MKPENSKESRANKSIGSKVTTKAAAIVGLAVAAMVVLAAILLGTNLWSGTQNSRSAGNPPTAASPSSGLAGKFRFQVGKPGPGDMAPPIRLPSTRTSTFDLASMRGKTVLLYFQEGIMCQPCWDQIRDIETNLAKFGTAGIDSVVSITTDPIDLLRQKVRNERLLTPVLSDPDLAVSKAYHANDFGMMGQSRDGHTFIVVGADGRIRWRADYGGAPDYTMYLPVANLLADIELGLARATK